MMFEKQKQEAGANSQQTQVGTVIIHNGIDEKRAREIVDERVPEIIKGYSQEARKTAENRIGCFANDLIPRLVKSNLLESLKNPSVQSLLIEAQKTAASTERPTDYALLSELLLHRVRKGSDRNARAGTSHAIKIVDEISDDALLALTVSYSVLKWSPTSGDICEGLNVLDNLFGKIIYSNLPSGKEWVEHLDVLDAVRINTLGSFKKMDQYFSEALSGYADVGIDKTSENYQKALDIIKSTDLPNDILCEHELRNGFVRLHIVNLDRLDEFTIVRMQNVSADGKVMKWAIPSKITDIQKEAVKKIYALYSNDNTLKNENVSAFMRKWDEHENLKKLRIWWDAIPTYYTITPVGKVLAHANAQRYDPTLPPLD